MEKKIVPVTVVIVNYKTLVLTRQAIVALYNSSVEPKEVILVDNDSQDGSVDILAREFPQIKIVANKENLGFAKANNQAIRQFSTQPYIWLLNSDTETGKKSLEELVGFMSLHPKIAALGPQLVYPNREWQSVGGFFPTAQNVFMYLVPFTVFLPKKILYTFKSIAFYPQPIQKDGVELDYVTGAACLLRKEALDQVGLLSEDYFMYFEETDLCWRLKKAGWQIKAIDTDPVMHVYGGSFKTKYDERRLGLFLSSLTFFVNRYYTGLTKTGILVEIFILAKVSLFFKKLKSFI